MKSGITGAFLIFSGLVFIGLLGYAFYVLIVPVLPVPVIFILGISAAVTVVLAPAWPELGKAFFNWRNS